MKKKQDSKLYQVTDELGNICATDCYCIKEEWWHIDKWLEMATWYTEFADNAVFIRQALERRHEKLGLKDRRVTII